MPNDFLAKKEQLFFYEGMRHIEGTIKEDLPVLRSTIVLGKDDRARFWLA